MKIAKYYFNINEVLGIDGYVRIDGRYNLEHAKYYAANNSHAKYLKNNHKATHYKIVITDSLLSDGKDLTSLIEL